MAAYFKGITQHREACEVFIAYMILVGGILYLASIKTF
jgi:hypothetical protein